jgi:hypothetical protein
VFVNIVVVVVLVVVVVVVATAADSHGIANDATCVVVAIRRRFTCRRAPRLGDGGSDKEEIRINRVKNGADLRRKT